MLMCSVQCTVCMLSKFSSLLLHRRYELPSSPCTRVPFCLCSCSSFSTSLNSCTRRRISSRRSCPNSRASRRACARLFAAAVCRWSATPRPGQNSGARPTPRDCARDQRPQSHIHAYRHARARTHQDRRGDDEVVLPAIVAGHGGVAGRPVVLPLLRAFGRGGAAGLLHALAARELGADGVGVLRRAAAAEDVVCGGDTLEAGVALGGRDVAAAGRVGVVRADEVVVFRFRRRGPKANGVWISCACLCCCC